MSSRSRDFSNRAAGDDTAFETLTIPRPDTLAPTKPSNLNSTSRESISRGTPRLDSLRIGDSSSLRSSYLSDGEKTNTTITDILKPNGLLQNEIDNGVKTVVSAGGKGSYFDKVASNAREVERNLTDNKAGAFALDLAKSVAKDHGLIDMADGGVAAWDAARRGDVVGTAKGLGQIGWGLLKGLGEVFGVNDIIRGVGCICRGEFLAGIGYLAFGVVGVMSLGTSCVARTALKVGFKAAARAGATALARAFEKSLVSAWAKDAAKSISKETLREAAKVASKEGAEVAGRAVGRIVEEKVAGYVSSRLLSSGFSAEAIKQLSESGIEHILQKQVRDTISRTGRLGLLKLSPRAGSFLLTHGGARHSIQVACSSSHGLKMIEESRSIMPSVLKELRELGKKHGVHKIADRFEDILNANVVRHVEKFVQSGAKLADGVAPDQYVKRLSECLRDQFQTASRLDLIRAYPDGLIKGIWAINKPLAKSISYSANLLPDSMVGALRSLVSADEAWGAGVRIAKRLEKLEATAGSEVKALENSVRKIASKETRKHLNVILKQSGFKTLVQGSTADILSGVRKAGIGELQEELGVSKRIAVGMKLMVSPTFFVPNWIAQPVGAAFSLATPKFFVDFFQNAVRVRIFDHFLAKEFQHVFRGAIGEKLGEMGFNTAMRSTAANVVEDWCERRGLGAEMKRDLTAACGDGIDEGLERAVRRQVAKGTKEGVEEYRGRRKHFRDGGPSSHRDQERKKIGELAAASAGGLASVSANLPDGNPQDSHATASHVGRHRWVKRADGSEVAVDEVV